MNPLFICLCRKGGPVAMIRQEVVVPSFISSIGARTRCFAVVVTCVAALFCNQAKAQAPACCSITSVDARAGLVSAKVNATGQSFQFKPNSAALLSSLRVGEGVYANFSSRQVSLDGKTICCTIVAVGPAPPSQPPIAKPPSSPQSGPLPKPTGAPQ